MEHRDAVALLDGGLSPGHAPQRWADLGCGAGTFTKALGQLLPEGSTILAVDRDAAALARVPQQFAGVSITKQVSDFAQDPLGATGFDGFLLANALHFVQDQPAFLRNAKASLKPGGRFLLVEYDTDTPNPWVPYPLSFRSLAALCMRVGLADVVRLADRPSAYGQARIYAAAAVR